MRLLIIDDNQTLAEITADLLRWIDRESRHIEAITVAGDLAAAIRLLPNHDAVLCDGWFPASQDSADIREEWGAVRHEAAQLGIRFVLYSGCVHTLDVARLQGIRTVSKPAAAEGIYTALTDHSAPDRMAALAGC